MPSGLSTPEIKIKYIILIGVKLESKIYLYHYMFNKVFSKD